MKLIRHILLLVIILGLWQGANAQRSRLIGSNEGLSSCLINDIFQDSKGYIWIATEYGLNRFDGTTFSHYYNIPGDKSSLVDSYVHSLIEHTPGKLLVGTVKGLMEYDRGAEAFRPIPLYAGKRHVVPHITEMKRMSNGDIWIGTAGYGIFRYKSDTGKVCHIDGLPGNLGSEFISCIYEDATHTVWIGTENNGLCRYYLEGRRIKEYRRPETGGDKISAICGDPDGKSVYVGSLDGGVDCIDQATGTVRHLSYPVPLSVKTLSMVNDVCYAGTEGHGAKIVSADGISDLPESNPLLPLSKGKVHKIVADRDGNIWTALYQQGVVLVPSLKRMFMSYGHPESYNNPIGNGAVMAICQSDNGNLWVSCENEGVFEIDRQMKRIRHISLPSTAMALMPDSRGGIWAGTFTSGLFHIAPGASAAEAVTALRDCKIYSLGEDAAGNIYVGTFGKGLLRYDPAGGTVRGVSVPGGMKRDSNQPCDWINNIMVMPDGKVWIAHYGGISCLDTSSGRYERFPDGRNLVGGCIGYALATDKHGHIWAGTTIGLFRYNPASGELRHFSTRDGMPNNVVCGICEDMGGNIWASTYRGVTKYVAAQGRFMTFDAGDGLQSNEFTHGAFCKDATGNIYFGGINGFSTFYPYDIDDKPREYRPVFTQLAIYSDPVTTRSLSGGKQIIDNEADLVGRVRLSHSDNTFSIGFSTLTFDNPDKLVFEYRVMEHGDEWLSTMPGQNHVTLNDIGPGDYHFQVRVAGDGSAQGTRTLAITVLPPWWQTWWAFVIYAIVVLLIVAGALHFLNMKVQQRREREESRKAEQILEAKLQFFTNISHEIRTPMTLIINPLEKLIDKCQDPNLKSVYSLIYRNAKRILNLVNQLMDMRKLDKGQMRMQMRETDMVTFVNNAMLPFEYTAAQKGISFRFSHGEEPIHAWIDTNNFDKVLLNIFSNAFKYTPENGSIDVRLDRIDDPDERPPLNECVQISVSDTGIGIDPGKLEKIFERFYRIENEVTDASSGTGIGLHLCRSLVELHHGTISASNREETSGCRFVIRIPSGMAHLSEDEMSTINIAAPLPRHDMPSLSIGTAEAVIHKPRTKNTVAIIEDDAEIRNFLTSELSSDYKVTTYSSAEEALRSILSADAPDIIISDVMMPGTDGYVLCHKIKTNVNINHIPVILISARTDDKYRMLGLEAGADSYLSKPFNMDVLKTTVTSLLANRNLLKAKFSGAQEQEANVKKITLRSHDEILLKKIMDVINANLSSADFSVEKLASEVGLSRVHLHRKLKELTNLPARDFIKSLRMRQAARLLREKKLSIAEVAYATGFSNPSHFSNSFKEMYGVSPTAYATQPAAETEPGPMPQSPLSPSDSGPAE